jgi:chromosome segregation ATPase
LNYLPIKLIFFSINSQDDSTSSFIQSQLHSVIASQRATIESLRDSIARAHVPRTDYDELLSRFEETQIHSADLQNQLDTSLAHSNELQDQLDAANKLSTQLQTELDNIHSKLTSTYTVLDEACAKIDLERSEFEKSLKHIRRTTNDEIRKNSELYAKTLAMEHTYVAQRQALDTRTNELKQLEKRLTKQEEHATNKINKLAVKLEQEKFISREIIQTGTNNLIK